MIAGLEPWATARAMVSAAGDAEGSRGRGAQRDAMLASHDLRPAGAPSLARGPRKERAFGDAMG